MDWLSNIGSLLNQYSNHQPGNPPASVEQDFDQVARTAPREEVSSGLAEAFRSDHTPPFASMLSQLFGQSSSPMRASVLNSLIAAAGPQLVSSILARYRAGQIPAQATQITPEQADQIPPDAVHDIAEAAQKQQPNIVDQMSSIYAEHPTLVKALGTAALGIAMSHLAKQKRGLF